MKFSDNDEEQVWAGEWHDIMKLELVVGFGIMNTKLSEKLGWWKTTYMQEYYYLRIRDLQNTSILNILQNKLVECARTRHQKYTLSCQHQRKNLNIFLHLNAIATCHNYILSYILFLNTFLTVFIAILVSFTNETFIALKRWLPQ